MGKTSFWVVALALVIVAAALMGASGDRRSVDVMKVQIEDASGDLLDIANGDITVTTATEDPCQSSGVAKSSIALAATADAELLAVSGSTVIYVCGFNFTLNGTAPTVRFQTGTGATCATGTVQETGVMLPSIGLNLLSAGGGYTIFSGAAGAALCVDVGGTTPSAQGVLTYVRV